MQQQQPQSLYGDNARFLHATKTTNPNDPIQFAFAITDEQGNEQILTGEVASASDFYTTCVESGWIREPRAVSINQKRTRISA